MALPKNRVLRLHMPQWQGGDLPGYNIGGRVLAAIAPQAGGPVETIDVPPVDEAERPEEQGIVSRSALMRQAAQAQAAIARHDPDGIVTLGGDCLVSLAPFAHLSARYCDDLAILWVDAHPDIMGPEQYNHAHAHVLGMLMGFGDRELGAAVTRPLTPDQILYVGLTEPSAWESAFIKDHGLTVLSPEDLARSGDAVTQWLRNSGKRHVAVHFDLDVLDPGRYDFLYFRNPAAAPGAFDGIAQGRMQMAQVSAILSQVATEMEVVGLTISEYLPWSVMEVSRLLESLPLLRVGTD